MKATVAFLEQVETCADSRIVGAAVSLLEWVGGLEAEVEVGGTESSLLVAAMQ